MIHTLQIYEELQKALGPDAAKAITNILAKIYDDLQNTVTKAEFNELREVVKELAEAQKKTEERLDALTHRVEELAEAQKRTEARVEELAEAQKKTEERLDALTHRVEELAEAQKRTEARVEELAKAQKKTEERLDALTHRVEELAEAQKRTEARVEELAEAQKRTEEELQKLIKEHGETRRQLGGLSMTVGYILENEAFKALPKLLKRDYGLDVKGRLRRQFVKDNQGQYIEVNIVGEAAQNGKTVMIVGESKSQLSKRGVDEFLRKKLRRLEGVFENMFPVLVTHMITSPDVENYAKDQGIALYYSFDF